jgi:uncharacterized cupredoxin-like copper-binding protein
MTKFRVAMIGIVSAVMLVWALPAMAHTTRTTGTSVSVTAGKPSEFKFTLSKMSVPAGSVTFSFSNKGALSHDFYVCSSSKGGSANSCAGKGTAVTAPGKSATLTLTLKAGSYEYLCTVPGHAAAGMKGDLKVT